MMNTQGLQQHYIRCKRLHPSPPYSLRSPLPLFFLLIFLIFLHSLPSYLSLSLISLIRLSSHFPFSFQFLFFLFLSPLQLSSSPLLFLPFPLSFLLPLPTYPLFSLCISTFFSLSCPLPLSFLFAFLDIHIYFGCIFQKYLMIKNNENNCKHNDENTHD